MGLGYYCSELSKMLPKKYHSEICFVGGVLFNRPTNDVDVFAYGEYATDIQDRLDGWRFSNGKEIEILDSLSTDDFIDSKGNILTEYILNTGLICNVSGYNFKKLTDEGLFLSKLTSFEQRGDETNKDLPDLEEIAKRFNNVIPANLKKIMKMFDLIDTYKMIEKYLV
jgi:hypothetical protein